MKKLFFSFTFFIFCNLLFGQNYGDFPKIEKEKLLSDLDLLYQGLDKFHTGMYWYTPKDSVDRAFEEAKQSINGEMNVLEFHKIIAPLVGLSREDHTDMSLPDFVFEKMNKDENIKFFPIFVKFIGNKMFVNINVSNCSEDISYKEIEQINGLTPKEIVKEIGQLFASDGFIKPVKYSDLNGFSFSNYFYYFFGNKNVFEVKFKDQEDIIEIEGLNLVQIKKNLKKYKDKNSSKNIETPLLELKFIDSKTAYIGIHDFDNSDIRKSVGMSLKKFLKQSFREIKERNIQNLIIDVSQNGGGSEGNEGLLYSYFGSNYQKYLKVRAKTQKAVLDNGIDKPIKLKTFGLYERIFINKKMEDGSLERKENAGHGLMAFKKKPKNPYHGKVFIIISPITYSGSSEFCNMMYSNGLATFVGQETGGGYYGNTSGYQRRLTLPHSQIRISIPALQFMMNVEPKIPFGRGVIPDYEVIPTIEQHKNQKNAPLEFILEELIKN